MFYIDLTYKSDERFDMSKFMQFTDTHDVLGSYFLSKLRELKPKGYYVVSVEEKRPDLLAARIYGNVQYWWLLLWYNDVMSIDELLPGAIVEFPDMADIEKLFYDLKSLEVSRS